MKWGGLNGAFEILLPPSNYVAHIVQLRLIVVIGGRFFFVKSPVGSGVVCIMYVT